MIYVYIFALIVGGLLLGASLILGGHADHAGVDGHVDPNATPTGAGDPQGIESLMLWMLSARFWTFFCAFFGLTGVILDGFGVIGSPIVAAVLAVGMGLFAGIFASWLVKVMTAESSNSAVATADYVGKRGSLVGGFGRGASGKVRLEVKGSTVDLLCSAMDDGTYETRDEVIVVEIDGTRAKIAKTRISTP